MDNSSKQLSTYLTEDDPLYQAVLSDAKDKAISVSAVIRMILKNHYRQQLEHARQFAGGQMPVTP